MKHLKLYEDYEEYFFTTAFLVNLFEKLNLKALPVGTLNKYSKHTPDDINTADLEWEYDINSELYDISFRTKENRIRFILELKKNNPDIVHYDEDFNEENVFKYELILYNNWM